MAVQMSITYNSQVNLHNKSLMELTLIAVIGHFALRGQVRSTCC